MDPLTISLYCQKVTQNSRGQWNAQFVVHEGEQTGIDIDVPYDTAIRLQGGTTYLFQEVAPPEPEPEPTP